MNFLIKEIKKESHDASNKGLTTHIPTVKSHSKWVVHTSGSNLPQAFSGLIGATRKERTITKREQMKKEKGIARKKGREGDIPLQDHEIGSSAGKDLQLRPQI